MVPVTPAYPTMEEERAKLRRCLKKLGSAIAIGILLFGKVLNLCNVQVVDSYVGMYLQIAGILCIAPMYYITAAVRGHNLFRFCACGALITEAAHFFLFLGVFRKGSWVIAEIIYVSILCLLLTAIEELFEEKQRLEIIPLNEVLVISRNADPRTQEQVINEQIEEHTENGFWRRVLRRLRRLRRT